MQIMNYTRREQSWLPGFMAGARDAVLGRMLEQLCDSEFYSVNPTLTHEGILGALIAREAQRTTAMGEGIAFPHARLAGLQQALFAVVTFEEPVMFEEFPVQIVCLILVPASDPTVSLKIMAQLSRLLLDPTIKKSVMDAQNPQEMRSIFSSYNPVIDKPILACDIMRLPHFSVKADDPVSACCHLMSVNNLQAVPVINERNEVLGEITVERLFRYGLPEFFTQLKSVSFIAEFDPFEKYFADESEMRAGDIMQDKAHTVPLDYTIMEAVFDLAIKSYPKLYVVNDDGRWVGTIDKGLVLDNVINY